MHAICPNRHGNIGAGVDQQLCCFGVRANHVHSPSSEKLQFPARQISFSQLDVIEAATRRLADFQEELALTAGFVPCKLRTIGDVVEKQCAEIFSQRVPSGRMGGCACRITQVPHQLGSPSSRVFIGARNCQRASRESRAALRYRSSRNP